MDAIEQFLRQKHTELTKDFSVALENDTLLNELPLVVSSIIYRLGQHYNGEDTIDADMSRLSPKDLHAMTAGEFEYTQILHALPYMCGKFALMEKRFFFIEGDFERELDENVLAESFNDGKPFLHPQTGAVVPDYQKKVYLALRVRVPN